MNYKERHIAKTIHFSLLLFLSISCPNRSNAQYPVTYSAGGYGGVAIDALGDVNGDGIEDIVVGYPTDPTTPQNMNNLGYVGSTSVLSGADLTPIYTFVGSTSLAQYGKVVVASEDLNGDGVKDILILSRLGGGGHIDVFSGLSGTILFSFSGQIFDAADVLSDYNSDGVPDIITVERQGFAVGPYTRIRSGIDGSILLSVSGVSPENAVSLNDISGDGVPDLVVMDPNAGAEIQFLSGFDGSLLHTGQQTVGVHSPFHLRRAGDLDGDGSIDVVSPGANGTLVVTSSTTGAAIHTIPVPPSTNPSSSLFSFDGGMDINQDGVPDIVGLSISAVNGASQRVVTYYSGSDASMLGSVLVSPPNSIAVRFAGNLDQDGVPDFVVGTT